MSIELKFEAKENYLLAYASGEWTTEAAADGIRKIREKAQTTGLTHILIDCTTISRPDTEMTRYYTGEVFASELGRPFKAVVVIPIEFINKFVENVATNRGARLFVTHNYDSALEWLDPK